MMIILKTIRDFLDTEKLKWLPGNFHTETCVLLREQGTPIKLHVFTHNGTYIGTIEDPHYYQYSFK